MKQPKSEFLRWFVQQFGKCPNAKLSTEELRDRVAKARYSLLRAEHELRKRDEWEEHKRAALYAWNAREASK